MRFFEVGLQIVDLDFAQRAFNHPRTSLCFLLVRARVSKHQIARKRYIRACTLDRKRLRDTRRSRFQVRGGYAGANGRRRKGLSASDVSAANMGSDYLVRPAVYKDIEGRGPLAQPPIREPGCGLLIDCPEVYF